MKTRRLDFNWKPLQLQISMTVESGVPDVQNYDSDLNEYTPDYGLTPLVIQPYVSVYEEDEMLGGLINPQLTDIKWSENINGVETVISNSGYYEIVRTGEEAGRLIIRKNIQNKEPATFVFEAKYLDPRNEQVVYIKGTHLVRCNNISETLRVELDAGQQVLYNPLNHPSQQTISATLWIGSNKSKEASYKWEIQENSLWRSIKDSDYFISVEESRVVIDRQSMGSELALRVFAERRGDNIKENSVSASTLIVRRIPEFEYDISGMPYNIPPGTEVVHPQSVVFNGQGLIENHDKELLSEWSIATNTLTGDMVYNVVAYGRYADIPLDKMDDALGAVIGLDVKDRGPMSALTDQSGELFSDADGSVIIIR